MSKLVLSIFSDRFDSTLKLQLMHKVYPILLRGITFLVFSVIITNLNAQRTAPVFGDATRLLELLYKDYSITSDYSTRNNDIAKDRNEVIQIFTRYNVELDLANQTLKAKLDSSKMQLETDKKNLEDRKNELKNFIENADKNKITSESTKTFQKKINDAEKLYFRTLFGVDSAKLIALNTYLSKPTISNAYLKDIADQFYEKYQSLQNSSFDQSALTGFAGSVDKGIPLLGSGGFDMAIQGLSKFLAGRIKEELTTYVIERIKEELRKSGPNDPLAEFKVLLPRTNAYLLSFNADQLVNFSSEIKQYIEDDLRHLLDNIGGLRNTPRIKELLLTYPELDLVIEALELIPKISKIKNPVDYFTLMDNTEFVNRWTNSADTLLFNMGNGIRMSTMLAYSLTVSDNGDLRFANTTELTKNLDDPNFYLSYFGLLSEQNRNHFEIKFLVGSAKDTFDLKTGFDCLMANIPPEEPEKIKTEIQELKHLYLELGTRSEQISEATLSIRRANKLGKKIGADTIKSYISGLIDYSEFLFDLSGTLCEKLTTYSSLDSATKVAFKTQFQTFKQRTAPYLAAARKTNEIIYDLQSKNYAVALIKAFELTTEFVPDNSRYTDMLYTLTSLTKKNFDLKEIHAEEWAEVVNHIIKKDNQVSNSIKKAAKTIENEIAAIVEEYTNSNSVTDPEILRNLFYFQNLLQKISEGISPSDYKYLQSQIEPIIDELKKAAKNKTSLVILEYYYGKLGVNIENGIVEQLKKITFKVKNKNNGDSIVPLFNPEEIKCFQNSISAIKISVGKYVFSNDKDQLLTTLKSQKDTLAFILTVLPDKFNFKLSETTLKLIHFVNDMAVAKDADEVSKAIEALALPSGSYTVKRTVKRNISINAYPGIAMAVDLTYKNQKPYWGFSPSFTAPIGINFGWSTPKGYSNSIFMSIIDIGAFTRMYLTKSNFSQDSTTVSTLPPATFLTIFSPGLHYSLGFKNTPLSFNVGVQYGPLLKTTLKTGEVRNYESIRFCAGLVLDIPLLNLHTKIRSFGQ